MSVHVHANSRTSLSPPRVFAVTSGAGGVEKTNVVANLAAALTLAGKRVAVVDGDLRCAHLALLLGASPRYTLADFFAGTVPLAEVLTTGHLGIRLLPAAGGVRQVTALSGAQKIVLLSELDSLAHEAELVLVDTGSGVSDAVTYFASAAHEIVVLVSPEPASLTAAYALVTLLASARQEKRFWVLANDVGDEREARRLYDDLSRATLRSSHTSLDLLGWIPRDHELTHAAARREMVVTASPDCPASQAFAAVARRLVQTTAEAARVKDGLQFFFPHILAASLSAGQAGTEERQ